MKKRMYYDAPFYCVVRLDGIKLGCARSRPVAWKLANSLERIYEANSK